MSCLLLLPAMAELGLHELVTRSGYPSTTTLSAWRSIGTLLLAKCARNARASHVTALTDDPGLALALALTALPKTTHLTSYRKSKPLTPASTSPSVDRGLAWWGE